MTRTPPFFLARDRPLSVATVGTAFLNAGGRVSAPFRRRQPTDQCRPRMASMSSNHNVPNPPMPIGRRRCRVNPVGFLKLAAEASGAAARSSSPGNVSIVYGKVRPW